jgi:hypothetical protein
MQSVYVSPLALLLITLYHIVHAIMLADDIIIYSQSLIDITIVMNWLLDSHQNVSYEKLGEILHSIINKNLFIDKFGRVFQPNTKTSAHKKNIYGALDIFHGRLINAGILPSATPYSLTHSLTHSYLLTYAGNPTISYSLLTHSLTHSYSLTQVSYHQLLLTHSHSYSYLLLLTNAGNPTISYSLHTHSYLLTYLLMQVSYHQLLLTHSLTLTYLLMQVSYHQLLLTHSLLSYLLTYLFHSIPLESTPSGLVGKACPLQHKVSV